MKKLLTLALAALMLAVLLPIPAMAEPITVLDFTQENAPASGDHWTWDKVSKTLTLNGVNITARLIFPDGATIMLPEGTINTINTYGKAGIVGEPEVGTGIVSMDTNGGENGTLYFKGTGTLKIIDNDSFYQITVQGNLIFGEEGELNGPQITMERTVPRNPLIGGSITVNSGTLNIKALSDPGVVIFGDVVVTGGSLDIEAMNGGIYGHLTVTGGNVKIKALNDGAGDGEEGIALEGLLKVEGGVVWLTSHTPGGHHADRFAPAILEEELGTGLTVRGSTTYNDTKPTQPVTWKTYGPSIDTPGGPEQSGLYPFIGDTPAKTVRISAGDDSGSQSGIIIYVPTDDTPTTTGNPTTGANDFVSTATAAALMALLGAAALPRK